MLSASTVLWAQGAYYLVTGLWPLVHMPSFLAVTGPKTDLWLVKTVGLLIVAVAAAVLTAAASGEISGQTFVLAALSALFLGGVDVVYSLKGVISKVYLGDAGLELVLLVLLALCRR